MMTHDIMFGKADRCGQFGRAHIAHACVIITLCVKTEPVTCVKSLLGEKMVTSQSIRRVPRRFYSRRHYFQVKLHLLISAQLILPSHDTS